MKTNFYSSLQLQRQERMSNILAGVILAVLCFTSQSAFANGAAYYLDPNGGATAGFDAGSGTYAQSSVQWISSSTGSGTDVAFPGSSPYFQMTFGNGGTTLPDLSGAFTVTLDTSRFHGIAVNSPGIDVTFAGSGNYYNSSSGDTYTIVAGSSLTMNTPRQGFDIGGTASLKGLNWNKANITFTNAGTGGGMINFPTPMGCNATNAIITENMPGGTVNLQMGSAAPSGLGTYNGGFVLVAGTLNFASAGSVNQFYGFTNGAYFAINGGIFDNTSGSPLTLNFAGGGGISLGGNFTFTGGSSLDFGTAPVTLTGNYTATVGASTLAIGGVISGSGFGLNVTGPGTLLLYGADTYSGNTVVTAGTLALTNGGSIASSPLIVSNGTFDVSLLSAAATLTSFGISNSTLVIAGLPVTTTNIMTTTLNVGGTTNVVSVTTLPLVASYPSTNHIIKAATVNGTLNFGLGTGTLPGGYNGYIVNNAASGSVDLVLTGGPAPVNLLTWSGAGGGGPVWDVESTPAWLNSSAQPAVFNELDFATFNDTAENPNVEINANVQPGSLTVSNNVLSYTFTGGSISDGSSSLTLNKQGAGTLLLQEGGDNFSGGINVSGGKVIIDNDSSSINGGATIGAGTTIQVGTNDTAGVLPTGTIVDNGALNFNRQDDITVANAISGNGSVNQVNTNTVILSDSGASSGNWTATITGGTMQVVDNTSLGSVPGGAVTITNGGTLDVGGNATLNTANYGAKQINIAGAGVGGNGVIVNSGSSQQQNAFQNVVLTADATFGGANRWDIRGGTALLDLGGHTLTKTNANQISVVSPHVTSGNIVIQQGILSFESTPNFDASAGTITVNSGGYVGQYKDTLGSFTRSIVLNGGGTTNLSGAGSVTFLGAPILLTANSTLGSSGGTETFNGVISDGGAGFSLTTAGIGTNILSATNTYTGNTYITSGALGLTNNGSIANSPQIVVNNNGAFDISGLVIPFSGTNTLLVGDDALGAGTFTLGNAQVTNFNYISISNAVLQMAVVNPGVPNITVTNLNLGDNGASGTINITAMSLVSLTQIPLIKYATATGTFNINIGNLPNGYSGNLVNNTANHSIDLQITGLPSGTWNGGSATDNNWSDAANWNGSGLTGTDPLNFGGTARLNNTNDTTETASSITFATGAGAFVLNGNAITLGGDVVNNSSSPQTVNLAQTLNTTPTNYNFNGGTAGLTVNGSLTGSAPAASAQMVALGGNGDLAGVISAGADASGGLILNVTNSGTWTVGGSGSSSFAGEIYITQGTLNFGSATESPSVTVTNWSTTGLGTGGFGQFVTIGGTSNLSTTATFNMKNGSLALNPVGAAATSFEFALGNVGALAQTGTPNASETANYNQTGGNVALSGFDLGTTPGVYIGNQSGVTSIFNVSGGTFNAGDSPFLVAVRGVGTVNISGTGTITETGTGTTGGNTSSGTMGITINDDRDVTNELPSSGTLNLNSGGTLNATSIRMTADRGGLSVNATMNFNGGTWRFNANGANLYASGTNGAVTIAGANYAGNDILAVNVRTNGAIIDNNGFAGVINMPLLHDATLGGTADGGLTENGSGTLTLSGINTYTGNTKINAGTLALSGSASIANSANIIISNSATLDVSARANGTLTLASGQTLQTATNGTLTGNLTNNAGSTVSPGGSGALGTLIVSGNVALNGSVAMEIGKAVTVTNDLLATASGSITYAGTLNVTLLSGTPVLGDSFKLFNAASYSGAFSAINLPTLTAGLAWANNLSANGTLQVVSAAKSKPQITSFRLSGTNLIFIGTNGADGGQYVLLMSTNVALPLADWTPVVTNNFDGSGNFNFTNGIAPNSTRQFYILSQ